MKYLIILLLPLLMISHSTIAIAAPMPVKSEKKVKPTGLKKSKKGLFPFFKNMKNWKKANGEYDQLNKRSNGLLALAIFSFLTFPWAIVGGALGGSIFLALAITSALGALVVDIFAIRLLRKHSQATPKKIKNKLIWALVLALLAGLIPLSILLAAGS